jgi:hyperosmotically inducible protein
MHPLGKASYRNTLIAAGLAAGLGMSAASVASDEDSQPQPRSDSVGAAISDSFITAQIKAKMFDEDTLKRSRITVTTTNGVVTLEGSAANRHAKSIAESLARAVDGVKSIDDQLSVPGSSQAATESHEVLDRAERTVSDSWITTKVKSAILADKAGRGFDVSVDTTHGVVVLTGALANRDSIDHVRDIAQRVHGVKSVDISSLTVAGS